MPSGSLVYHTVALWYIQALATSGSTDCGASLQYKSSLGGIKSLRPVNFPVIGVKRVIGSWSPSWAYVLNCLNGTSLAVSAEKPNHTRQHQNFVPVGTKDGTNNREVISSFWHHYPSLFSG